MKNKTLYVILFILCVFISVNTSAYAGIKMEYESVTGGKTFKIDYLLDKDNIRMDKKAGDKSMSLIYRTDKDTFYTVDHNNKAYMEMTREDMKKMKESIEKLRKRFEKVYPDKSGESKKDKEPLRYKKIKTGDKINKWICDQYMGYEGQVKKSDVWTVTFEKLGFKPGDFKMFTAVEGFLGEIKGEDSDISSRNDMSPGFKKTKFDYYGIPVKGVYYRKGKISKTMELKKITGANFPGSVFKIPEGYTKKKSRRRRR